MTAVHETSIVPIGGSELAGDPSATKVKLATVLDQSPAMPR